MAMNHRSSSSYPPTLESIINIIAPVLQIRYLPRDSGEVLLKGGEKSLQGIEQSDACLSNVLASVLQSMNLLECVYLHLVVEFYKFLRFGGVWKENVSRGRLPGARTRNIQKVASLADCVGEVCSGNHKLQFKELQMHEYQLSALP